MTVTELLSILGISLGLSADCFAVAVSSGVSLGSGRARMLKVALSFGLFQAVMPVLGWLAGTTIVGYIGQYDHWVAFGLLAFVGGRMVYESFHHEGEAARKTDIGRWLPLLVLSVATSIDALAVGLSFALLEVNIAVASVIIGVVAFGVTMVGLFVGRKSHQLLGKRMELVGGIILIGIGLRILITHALG